MYDYSFIYLLRVEIDLAKSKFIISQTRNKDLIEIKQKKKIQIQFK